MVRLPDSFLNSAVYNYASLKVKFVPNKELVVTLTIPGKASTNTRTKTLLGLSIITQVSPDVGAWTGENMKRTKLVITAS